MSTVFYPARLQDDEDGGFVVTFRDVPEAITQGEDYHDAIDMALEALKTAMEFYDEKGEGYPTPSEPQEGEEMISVYQADKNQFPNKVTSEALDELIAASKVEYTKLGLKTTHCMITLPCGFTISGESACVDPANYDKELGEKYALEKAKDSLWAFEGYLLAWRLHTRAEWLENQTDEPLEPCISQQKEV